MFAWALLGFTAAVAGVVHAAANVESVRGDVRAGSAPLALKDRVTSGATITTGTGAQAVLRFDDGQQVVLNENTVFRIVDFRYREEEPRNDRAIFDLVRGALRVVTGLVGARNQNNFQLRVPQATIGIRGTDFMVALVNPAYTSVLHGAISVSNSGGTTVFGAGSFGSVASANGLAVSIPSSALPAAASSAFSSMGAAAGVTAGGLAPGAGPAPVTATAAAPGVGAAAAVGLGIAAGIGIMNDNSTTSHH
jgi:hypothetical protein